MNRYEKHRMQDPRLPFIFHDYHFPKGKIVKNNWHQNIELLCVVEGSAAVMTDGQRFFANAGDIIVVNTNGIHSLVATSDLHFYCLIINREFCIENFCDTNTVRFSAFLQDSELMALAGRFANLYQSEDSDFRILLLRTWLLDFLALLCSRYGERVERPMEDSQLSGAIKQVIGYIHSESHRTITLEELSELVGISSCYLSRMFHRITGYSIVTYINHTRCERAKQLLAQQNLSVEAVAYECGFANVSYFIRTFRKMTGTVPSEYRARFLRERQEEETSQPCKDL